MSQEINIVKLDFPDNIRMRPGMYIGSIDNPSVLLREAIDNSIDELYGHKLTSQIFIHTADTADDWDVVADNGRGIPIVWDDEYQMTKTCLAVTSTHTGSKFDKNEVAVGMNGIGISATNALSNKFIILSKVTKDNYNKSIPIVKDRWMTNVGQELFYFIAFEKGLKVGESCMTHSEIAERYKIDFPMGMSTVTAFIPDSTIFKDWKCTIPRKNLTYVMAIMRKIYNRNVTITLNESTLNDEYQPYQFEFIKEVKADISGKTRRATFYINFECDTNMSVSEFSGSVNSLVVDRGNHIEAVKHAYGETLKNYYGLSYSNVLCGLRMNVIVIAAEVDFSSQTKERCTKVEGMGLQDMAKGLTNEFRRIFKDNADYFENHIIKLNEYISSLTKISTINKIKAAIGTVSGSSRVQSKVPKSVRDASIKNRLDAELYICEGKSASGNIMKTRDPRTQAVQELRGVPLNTMGKDLDDILNNEEMKSIITAIGVGVNEHHDMKLARYGKIIIACDADSDGFRIASLILGFIAQRMTFLINKGMVYVLRSPLYIQNGRYIYPEDAELLDRSKPYTRIKGLGELSERQSYDVITNKDSRKLIQITPENSADAIQLLSSSTARKQLMIDENIVQDPFNIGLWY